MIYVYVPIPFIRREINTNKLGVCVWKDDLGNRPEPQIFLMRIENCYKQAIISVMSLWPYEATSNPQEVLRI
jgi:hypothetical protein